MHTHMQVWLNTLMFVTGFLIDGSIAIIGLMAMEIVPKKLAGSAHGLACAVAQGKCYSVIRAMNSQCSENTGFLKLSWLAQL